jgi:hypothetical protein
MSSSCIRTRLFSSAAAEATGTSRPPESSSTTDAGAELDSLRKDLAIKDNQIKELKVMHQTCPFLSSLTPLIAGYQ